MRKGVMRCPDNLAATQPNSPQVESEEHEFPNLSQSPAGGQYLTFRPMDMEDVRQLQANNAAPAELGNRLPLRLELCVEEGVVGIEAAICECGERNDQHC